MRDSSRTPVPARAQASFDSWLAGAQAACPLLQDCSIEAYHHGALSIRLGFSFGLALELFSTPGGDQEARLHELCPSCQRDVRRAEGCSLCGFRTPPGQSVGDFTVSYLGMRGVAYSLTLLGHIERRLASRLEELSVDPLSCILYGPLLVDLLRAGVIDVFGFNPRPQ